MSASDRFTMIRTKRIKKDFEKFYKDPAEKIDVYGDPDDTLKVWFLLKGRDDSFFKDGYYLGSIQHSPDYPRKGPEFIVYTPSGRFMPGKKICLSNSSYHPESWSPTWTLTAILTGFDSIWHSSDPSDYSGISHIKPDKKTCEDLAPKTFKWNMKNYPEIMNKFHRFVSVDNSMEDLGISVYEELTKK